MNDLKIVDAHHHLWDLNNKDTSYPWLMVTEGEAFFGDYGAIRKSYLLDDYLEDAKNQNVIKSVHVQAEHDDDKPVNETAWLQHVADTHSSNLPNAIVAYADFSKDNISSDSTNISKQFGSLKFGQPSLLFLNSNELLVCFWCIEDNQHIIKTFIVNI